MLGEIVVDHQRVLAVVAEVLAHGSRGVGSEIQHRRRLRRGGGNDDGVLQRVVLSQRLHKLRDRGTLLADGAVDADQVVLRVVDDGVERDGSLAGLAVADDELALAAANRDHAVDGLEASGHGLAHRLAGDDAGGEPLYAAESPSVMMGPLSSMGWPSALTTRPIMASPTGTLRILPVRLTSLPSLISV